MFSFFSLLGALSAAAISTPPSVQGGATPANIVSSQEARRTIIGCGLPDQRVSISHDQDMQEDVVWIASDKALLSDSMLVCLARASLKTIHYVQFRDDAAQKRYSSVYSKVGRETGVAEARNWLSKRNLLAAMPIPKKGGSLAGYAKAVETFCGVRSGALLAAQADDMITVTKDGLGHFTSKGIEGAAATTKQFECVMNVMSAADLVSHGISFGFMGNEATSVR